MSNNPAPKETPKGDGWRFLLKDIFVPIMVAAIGAGGLGLLINARNNEEAVPPAEPAAMAAIVEVVATATDTMAELDTATPTSLPPTETPTETPLPPTDTPTSTLTPTPTLTETPLLPTETPTETPTQTPTSTATSTAMPLVVATATPPPEATTTPAVELASTLALDKQVLLQFAADPTDWFQMDVTEVTNAQYQACVADGRCTESYAGFSTGFYEADHPVVGVTGDQAAAYCAWVDGRLPTVEEWLAAATTNGENEYPWGDDEKKNLSTYAVVDQKGCGGKDAGTCPVGSKSPAGDSPAGIQDLIGNVWEWTGDAGKKKQNALIVGGSWSDKAKDEFFDTPLSKHIIREVAIDPKDPQNNLGFRCVYDELANQN